MSPKSDRDPTAADAFVHLAADQLIADLRSGLEPSLVHVADERHGRHEIGLEPLDGQHPSTLLVGFTAPEEWHALGLAVRGYAYPLSERSDVRTRQRTRVHIVTLISRSGETAQRMHVPDDLDLERALGADPGDAGGEQIDLLRLALGLGTDEPPCPSDVYWTIEWLSALLGTDTGALQTWPDVIVRHPAMRLLHQTGRTEDDIVEVAAAFGRVCHWRRLRRWARDGAFTPPELVPSDGDWFDDGAFARFLLSRCPPLAMLRAQIREHLAGHLVARLERTLDALAIPASSWPDVSSAAPDR